MSALGHWQTSEHNSATIALHPKVDILTRGIDVGYVPKEDVR
jgi:hypothetical protein